MITAIGGFNAKGNIGRNSMIKLRIIWTLVLACTFYSGGCSSDGEIVPVPPPGRTDQAEKITEWLTGTPGWTADGQEVVFITGLCSPWCSIVAGQDQTEIIPKDIGFEYPNSFSISPDGSIMAVSAEDNPISRADLYLVSLPGLEITHLLRGWSNERRPCWAPDGTKLVFDAGSLGSRNIEVLFLADHSNMALTDSTSDDIDPSWSPDGSRIAFASNRTGEWELWTMAEDGGQLMQLTTEGGLSPTWSPDSDRIAFERDYRLWVMDRNGDNDALLSGDPGLNPVWSPSGDRIAFSTHDGYYVSLLALWTLPVE
jgi:hypothetical protein